jgi:hexosaminidase
MIWFVLLAFGVAYAQARNITVVPEIEIPGHSLAALESYLELSCTGGPFKAAESWCVMHDVDCAGNEETFTFLENVLTEILDLFPGKYIHIGGDECPKDRWHECAKCQARIKAEGLKDEYAPNRAICRPERTESRLLDH